MRQQEWRDPARLLVSLSWAVVVVPRLVQTFTSSKHRASVGAGIPESALSVQTSRLLELSLLALCLGIVLRRARRLPLDRLPTLAVIVAPWFFMLLRDLSLGTEPKIASILFPFVALAVWVLRPPIERLGLLGVLVGWTALLSLALGVLAPDRGVFTEATGQEITPTKQLLPWGVLIGPFTDPNNLGQFLVLGLPAVALVRGRATRVWIVLVTMAALVWTSSRSSLGTVAAGALAAAVLAHLHPVTKRTIGRLLVVHLAAAPVLVPLLVTSDTAFTNRGYLWKHGFITWRESPWLGHGSAWYSENGKFANALGQLAFHGHNQFIHTLVTGGLLYLALTAALMVALTYVAGVWAHRRVTYPVVYLCMFLVSCTLEVSFGVVDRGFLLAVTILPMSFFAFARREDTLPVLRIHHRRPPSVQEVSTTATSSALTSSSDSTASASPRRSVNRS